MRENSSEMHFEGQGSLTTVDGLSFVGTFEKDKRTGKGNLPSDWRNSIWILGQ